MRENTACFDWGERAKVTACFKGGGGGGERAKDTTNCCDGHGDDNTFSISFHCTECNAACVGARQCSLTAIDGCCNYFDFDDNCVTSCPSGQTPNADNDCSGGP